MELAVILEGGDGRVERDDEQCRSISGCFYIIHCVFFSRLFFFFSYAKRKCVSLAIFLKSYIIIK